MTSLTIASEVCKTVLRAYGSLVALLDPGHEGSPYVPARSSEDVIHFKSMNKPFSWPSRRRMMIRI